MSGSNYFFVLVQISLAIQLASCIEQNELYIPNIQETDSIASANSLCTLIEKYYQSGRSIHRFDPDTELGFSAYVVSSDEGGNFYKTMVLQDQPNNPHCGVQLRLNMSDYYERFGIGQKIFINAAGLSMAEEKGSLVIGYQLNSRLSEIPMTLINRHLLRSEEIVTIRPTKSTIGELSKDMINTYILLEDVQFSWQELGRSLSSERFDTFQGVRLMEQCEGGGSLPLRTSTYSNFSFFEIPPSRCSVTGILIKDYYSEELSLVINSIDDLEEIEGERCDPKLYECRIEEVMNYHPLFYENFDDLKSTAQLTELGWINRNLFLGSTRFKKRSSNGNTFVQVSCYGSGELKTECWLVSPTIEIPEDRMVRFSFNTRATFDDGRQLTVWLTTDTDKSIEEANWQQIAAQISDGSRDGSNSEFRHSGTIPLSCLEGRVRIGFKYLGSDPSATTTYDIDQILFEISSERYNQRSPEGDH